ncbi:MAG: MGMT family protein [Fimbriimonadaceae bacterium]|nr:MGMT family protein [Fimbriimonadaceae bacterium]
MTAREELYRLVRTIPPGRLATYGDLGRSLSRPVSGLIVGGWMASCPADAPWWRVVGRDGTLLLAKRSPHFAADQQSRLEAEGVPFRDGRALGDGRWFLPEVLTDLPPSP